jgi:CRP/FNR family cyclic AMP-dependent transcriptional regulator
MPGKVSWYRIDAVSNLKRRFRFHDTTACASRGNSELTHYSMPKPTGPAQEQFLSTLQMAQNRLEYLTPNDWALLIDRAKEVTFQKDEILIQKGKQTKMVYLLVKGTARIEADFNARIAQIGPGQISGEMAFLQNNVASATVTAAEEVKAYAIDWSALGDLFELFPHMASRFYRSLAVILAHRLRDQIIGEAWK